jgi:3-phenylpropionate/trans-cinnamate dioxygenase ferredoxin reductase component
MSTTSQTFAVVGAGLAAAKAVEALRAGGFEGRIEVYGDEPHLPYERPPLSKGYLLGNDELELVFVHPQQWYADHAVDLHLGSTVTGIDLGEKIVLAGDERQPFDRLLLATGSTPRHLAMADSSGVPVAYLRTLDDSQRLKAMLTPGARVAIIGGGWIGLEVAAAARTAGAEVTVLEGLDLPLLRVLGPEVARVLAAVHRDHGVDLRTSVHVAAVERDAERSVVRLADGSSVTADLVVVGIGVTPNVALAASAGLATDNGVLSDEHLRTSHPDVFVAGDVANAWHPLLGRRVRVEHWDNAIEQGALAARSMLGEDVSYARMPYFFSDQYDLGMEYVGSVGPEGYDEVVVRGDTDQVAGRADQAVFTAFWLRGGQVLAGMHVNDWAAIEPIRAIVGHSVDAGRLRDPSVKLEDLVTQ